MLRIVSLFVDAVIIQDDYIARAIDNFFLEFACLGILDQRTMAYKALDQPLGFSAMSCSILELVMRIVIAYACVARSLKFVNLEIFALA